MTVTKSVGGHRNQVVRALSWPDEGYGGVEAARTLLARPSPEVEIEGLYSTLLRHKTILIALDHLERAGADLDRLTISSRLFRSHSAFAGMEPSAEDRVSLNEVRRRFDIHERLVRDLEDTVLMGAMGADVLFLYGRGLRAGYAGYRHGVSHDVDVFMRDAEAGLHLIDQLCMRSAFALIGVRTSRSAGKRLGHFVLFKASDEGHFLGIDLIIRGRPGGPGLLPPFTLDPMPRSRFVSLRDRPAHVPGPEDVLLLTAEKVRRSGKLVSRHLNDARFVLATHAQSLDWNYLTSAAVQHGLTPFLHLLVKDAEDQEDRQLAPSSTIARLAPTGFEALIIDLLNVRDAVAKETLPARVLRAKPGIRRKVWSATWYLKYLRAERPHASRWSHLVTDELRGQLLTRSIRRAQSRINGRVQTFGDHSPVFRFAGVAALGKRGRLERREYSRLATRDVDRHEMS